MTDAPLAIPLLTSARIQARIHELGAALSPPDHGDVVLVADLNGCLPFVADLARAMSGRVSVDFLSVSTYAGGSDRARLRKDVDTDLYGRDVILVDDIVDTGLELTYLTSELARREPASLRVCTLLDRPQRRILPVRLDHVGFEVPDAFLVGYGLGFEGRYRNLDLVAIADHDVLVADPDAYVAQLYGPAGRGHEPQKA